MHSIMFNDRVRLTEDLPEIDLFRGEIGIVRGAWLYPNTAYEVEFAAAEPGMPPCCLLLLQDQVAPAQLEHREERRGTPDLSGRQLHRLGVGCGARNLRSPDPGLRSR